MLRARVWRERNASMAGRQDWQSYKLTGRNTHDRPVRYGGHEAIPIGLQYIARRDAHVGTTPGETQLAMTVPAMMIACSALAGLLALVLSFAARGPLSRRLAVVSLWLALAAVPASVASDLLGPEEPGDAKADTLALVISHAKNYGALVLPFAGLAMVAMRRASITSSRRRQ